MIDALEPWSGFDELFFREASSRLGQEGTQAHLQSLNQYTFSGKKPYPFGLPVCLRHETFAQLQHFLRSYTRLIQSIVKQYRENEELRNYISLPDPLSEFAKKANPVGDTIDFCRADFFVNESGFQVLETNANCPGGLIYAGIAAAIWREVLTDNVALSEMDFERPTWMADWFLREIAGTDDVGFVPIIRERGGHELELDTHREQFINRGVRCELIDPRELTSMGGGVFWEGQPVRMAYQKIGMPEFCAMAPEMPAYLNALQSGSVRIQNGLLGRWIGDNKLCLAVISDPRFSALFPDDLLATVRPHVPWSRNIAFCGDEELQVLLRSKDRYVLKRPLDTRGRGVVIGKDVGDHDEWLAVVERAVREGWLCMEYVPTSGLTRHDLDGEAVRHDLAVGTVGGEIIGGYSRSSRDERVNVALNGRLHPLFFGTA